MTAEAILASSGIYVIRNKINGKRYVGSAAEFSRRFRRHKGCLARKEHHSLKLQRAWDKYGADAFEFVVLEVVDKAQLLEREQYWIDALSAYGPNGYNMIPKAANHLGAKRGPEASARMSAGQRGRKHPPETIAKIIAAIKQRPPMSDETRAKLSAANAGAKRSPEAIRNMTAGQRAFFEAGKQRVPITEETRRKLAETSKGRRHTQESIEKIAATKRGRKRGPMPDEWKEKIRKAMAGKSKSAEHIETQKAGIKNSEAFAAAKKQLSDSQRVAVIVDGVRYASYGIAAEALGCSHALITKRVKEGTILKAGPEVPA